MDEHDDDILSEVREGATEERDSFPDTDDDVDDSEDVDSERVNLDEDESEL
jgi:hypothetical protein